jgi:16S rRNA (guanine966-N2)-methyltransferase
VAPRGDVARPTTDRVKESVFNALGSLGVLLDATVLDLFAGSGALGIEALSRGAARATFVDEDRRSLDAVRANLSAAGLGDRATVVRDDALRYLARRDATAPRPAPPTGSSARSPFVVVADPPYRFDRWGELLEALAALPGADGAQPLLVVAESDRPLPPAARWQVVRHRSYGSTLVTFLQLHRTGHGDAGNEDVSGHVDRWKGTVAGVPDHRSEE